MAVSVVEPSAASPLYPVFLRLDARRVLVVGGGRVASGKLPALLRAGARVTVVAPRIREQLRSPGVELRQRAFLPADLDGAFFVIAAATPEVNRAVAAAADERGVFVNAVDDAANASAYLGGVVERGGVTVAVSTGGRAPALAGLLREALEAVLPDEVGEWVSIGERIRARWKERGVPIPDRRPLLFRALQDLYAAKEAP
jgi:uroporphyrin-III C-methyltransferase/precorrin-2 dehydrogenase/sirohydrochlorin ferrochelatase